MHHCGMLFTLWIYIVYMTGMTGLADSFHLTGYRNSVGFHMTVLPFMSLPYVCKSKLMAMGFLLQIDLFISLCFALGSIFRPVGRPTFFPKLISIIPYLTIGSSLLATPHFTSLCQQAMGDVMPHRAEVNKIRTTCCPRPWGSGWSGCSSSFIE